MLQYCNTADFKKLTPSELRKAIDSVRNTPRMTYNYDLEDDDDYDDYGNYSEDSYNSDNDMPGVPIISVAASSNNFLQTQTACSAEPEELTYGYGCQTNSGAHIKVNKSKLVFLYCYK